MSKVYVNKEWSRLAIRRLLENPVPPIIGTVQHMDYFTFRDRETKALSGLNVLEIGPGMWLLVKGEWGL